MSPVGSIECAAVNVDGVIYFLPRPNRHWNILRAMRAGVGDPEDHENLCGFLTTKGRFANRKAAAHIARRSGQTDSECAYLMSEDLW